MMIQRFFHRYGFGIQSPWAYSLVRNVLFEPLRYYAFDELQAKHPQCSKTERKRNEQLFRIVNHFKPQKIEIVGNTVASTRDYLSFQSLSANSQQSTVNTQLFFYFISPLALAVRRFLSQLGSCRFCSSEAISSMRSPLLVSNTMR